MATLHIRDAETGWPVALDVSEEGNLVAVDIYTEKLHQGNSYFGSCDVVTVASGVERTLGVAVGALASDGYIQSFFRTIAGGDARVWLHEAVTYSGGATITMFNKNRMSSKTLDNVVVTCNPTLTVSGTVLAKQGDAVGEFTFGGMSVVERGWLLRANTSYLLRIRADDDTDAVEICVTIVTES